MLNYLLRIVFNIRSDEFKKAKYLIVFFFSVGFYFTLQGSISISVFDMRFGAKYLPFILFVFPVINLLFSYAYLKALSSIGKKKLFRYFMFFVFIVHIFNFLILNDIFQSKIFFAILLLLSLLVNEKLYFISMVLIQDIEDIESIKRILPLSTAIFTVASMLGAFFISRFAGIIPVKTLYLLSGLSIFIIAIFADVIMKRFKSVSEGSRNDNDGGFGETFKYLKDNSFLFLIILVAVVVDFTFNINDYLYNVIGSGAIPREAEFVGFVGLTETFRYILTLIVDLFIFTKIVTKFGSLNVVKIIFINAIIGSVIILAAPDRIYWVMASKIIFTVLVMLLSYSLMQILYQPAHQKYREKVMVIADTIVVMTGSLIGGGVTLLHSYGYINTPFINIVSIIAAASMLVLWQIKQAGFIRIIEQSMNLSDNVDINKLFGKMGILSILPYISAKIEQGKNFEKILVLDLLKRMNLDGKERFFKKVLLLKDLELKMKVIDMVFDESIPFEVITESCGEMTGDIDTTQYLLYNLFINYKLSFKNNAIDKFSELMAGMDKTRLNELQLKMFEYLYEGDTKAYEVIINRLAVSKKSSDLKILLKIMVNFAGIEDDKNRAVLISIMLNLKGYQGILKDTAKLCSVYDKDMDMMYLKEVFTGYCESEVVESVCSCYGYDTVIKSLKGNNLLIPQLYILHSAAMQNRDQIDKYLNIYTEVKGKLKALVIEKLKIQGASHSVKNLLSAELDKLISSVSAILLEFLFAYYGVSKVANIEKNLRAIEGRKLIHEIVRNALPVKVSNEMLPILEEKLQINEPAFNYSMFTVGGMHNILTNLYMILGGESMEEQFKKEIDMISVLKKTSVFKNLDIESLYELLRIGEFVNFGRDETVVRKNEAADKLYVMIDGAAGKYQDDSGDSFTTVECGEMLGEEVVIGGSLRMATVRTFDSSVFFRVNGEEFVSQVRTNNILAYSLLEVLAGKLRNDMKVN